MSAATTAALSVACFGEILWDCLPRGLYLGGAPLNVAYHLRTLGAAPLMVSAVGRDFLGREAIRRLTAWKLDLSGIAQNGRATGTVIAALDGRGAADYTFSPCPAWDAIPVAHALLRQRPPPCAIVFGTLALRALHNRSRLGNLLETWPEARRIVDLNLRAPFAKMDTIKWAVRRANLLKLNSDELACLVPVCRNSPAGWARSARQLARRHDLDHVCVTAGARGAGLLWRGDWFWVDGRPVKVRDTVGAGDAFLAALIHGVYQQGDAPLAALDRACRLGEFVAGCDGATPAYGIDARGRPVASRD